MAPKRMMLGVALAACLLALAAKSVSGQAAAAASAGKTTGAATQAVVGKLPAASLASQCKSSVGVSPWDNGYHFPDVILCCGGSIDFQWSGLSSVWQISSRTCPATFRNTTTSKQLLPPTQGSGGVKSLYLPIPGTYYFTSATPGACTGGLIFAAQVPPGSGSVCPATAAPVTPAPTPKATAAPTPVPSAPNAAASAIGPPGGTSTSTAPGAAASASGPPGTSQTATAPGMSFSSSGNFGRKLKALVTSMAAM